MSRQLKGIPISVLDLAPIAEGQRPADAFRNSVALAQAAEKAGFTRYWLAEHHNMESIASAATSVLIGYIAANTSIIRVGSGGIMLPNHAPLVIAEQFGTLASLFPERIDLGIGRAPGTDQVTSYALRRNLKGSVDEFPNDVLELQNYLAPANPASKVRAIPGEGTMVPLWLLGSGTYSAQLAAALGLPFAFASHFAPAQLFDALSLYKHLFKPSAQLKTPYSIACVNVVAAETDEEARYLATSFYMLALGIVRNLRKPLQPPVNDMEQVWQKHEKDAVDQIARFSFVGSKETVKEALQHFVDSTGINELMVACYIYDINKRIRSYEILADLFKKADH